MDQLIDEYKKDTLDFLAKARRVDIAQNQKRIAYYKMLHSKGEVRAAEHEMLSGVELIQTKI